MKNANTQTNVADKFKKAEIKESIKKKPFYILKECLQCYTKAKLTNIAHLHGIHLKQSQRKAEMVDIVEKTLIKSISRDSLYMTNLERELLVDIVSKDQVADSPLQGIDPLKRLGYVYVFYYKNSFYTIIPRELAEEFSKANQRGNEEKIHRNNEIYKYLKALVELYGIYTVEQLILIWNHYHKEKLSKKEAHEYMSVVEGKQGYFSWNPPYVISGYFEEEKEYQKLLREASNREYYTPTLQEINDLAQNKYYQENIYYKKVGEYLRKTSKLEQSTLEDITLYLKVTCILDKPFQGIFRELRKAGYIFKNLREANYFTRLCVDFNNHTRKWSLRGYKPVEIMEEEKLQPLHTKTPLVKGKKIGRNKICPCGSGIKYKKCCGK